MVEMAVVAMPEFDDDGDDVITRLEGVTSRLEQVVDEAKRVLGHAREEHRQRWSGIERRLEDVGHEPDRRSNDGG